MSFRPVAFRPPTIRPQTRPSPPSLSPDVAIGPGPRLVGPSPALGAENIAVGAPSQPPPTTMRRGDCAPSAGLMVNLMAISARHRLRPVRLCLSVSAADGADIPRGGACRAVIRQFIVRDGAGRRPQEGGLGGSTTPPSWASASSAYHTTIHYW